MKTLRFEHKDQDKRELFGWIGEACASAEVRNSLGAPITSSAGDVWLVVTKDNALLGFCAISRLKSRNAARMHALYSVDTALALTVESTLRKAAENEAIAAGASEISTVDKVERVKVYEFNKWQVTGTRGQNYRTSSKQLGKVKK